MLKRIKCLNSCEEAIGCVCLYVSPKLFFYIESLDTPMDMWRKFWYLFGKIDETQGHILDNELTSFNPCNFENI